MSSTTGAATARPDSSTCASSFRMAERAAIRAEGGTFDALAAGPDDGRPVLLLHGFPECAEQWEHQLGALAEAGCRAVAFDQRGYSPGVRPSAVDADAPGGVNRDGGGG